MELPDNINRLTKGEYVHDMLSDDCHPLSWAIDHPDICPSNCDVVPLWEGDSSITGFMRLEDGVQFVKFDIEDPDRYEILGPTINSVITNLLIRYWTEQEAEDEDLIEVAYLLEYPHIKNLLEQIEIANEEENEPQEDWERRFRQNYL
jgi:hypothetical protein